MKTSIPCNLKATPDPLWDRSAVHSANRHEIPDEITASIDRAADTVLQRLWGRT